MQTVRVLLAHLFGRRHRLGNRGAVLVEYTAVFAFVSIGLTIAIVKLGPTLIQAWGSSQTALLAAKP